MTKKELIRKAAIQIFREKGYSGTTLRYQPGSGRQRFYRILLLWLEGKHVQDTFPRRYGTAGTEAPRADRERSDPPLCAEGLFGRFHPRHRKGSRGEQRGDFLLLRRQERALFCDSSEGSALLVDFVEQAAHGDHTPMEIMEMYSRFFYRLMKEHPYILRIFSWK